MLIPISAISHIQNFIMVIGTTVIMVQWLFLCDISLFLFRTMYIFPVNHQKQREKIWCLALF